MSEIGPDSSRSKAAILLALGGAVAIACFAMMRLTGRQEDPRYPRTEEQMEHRSKAHDAAPDQDLNPDLPRPRHGRP